eukprot:gb/GECG01012215.1/.p1 GENE.gb/GECG01012215.1/~~gb/GECG01012215.1/.p1  ORF type:complete len:133 (+),score=19.70 gb/GECG01012215.1/:1-399(+)
MAANNNPNKAPSSEMDILLHRTTPAPEGGGGASTGAHYTPYEGKKKLQGTRRKAKTSVSPDSSGSTMNQHQAQSMKASYNDPCYELGQESLRCSLANPSTKSETCKEQFLQWKMCFQEAREEKAKQRMRVTD